MKAFIVFKMIDANIMIPYPKRNLIYELVALTKAYCEFIYIFGNHVVHFYFITVTQLQLFQKASLHYVHLILLKLETI